MCRTFRWMPFRQENGENISNTIKVRRIEIYGTDSKFPYRTINRPSQQKYAIFIIKFHCTNE